MESLIRNLVEKNQSAIDRNGKILAKSRAIKFLLGEENEKVIFVYATINRSFKFWKVKFIFYKKNEKVKIIYCSKAYCRLGNLEKFV